MGMTTATGSLGGSLLSWGAAVLLAGSLLTACDNPKAKAPAAAPPPAVGVVKVEMRDVFPAAEFTGRIEAIDKVEIRARVRGFLQQRLFKEGDTVKEGDLLYVIEQAPYEAEVQQREAELESAQADVADANVQLQRAEELVKRGNIPVAEVDRRRANDLMAKAKVAQAKAALDEAKINLSYTEIRAPVAGKVGRSAYSPGNLVGEGTSPLTVIVSQDPIYVTFSISQTQLMEVRRRRENQPPDGKAYVAKLQFADGSTYEHDGYIDFVDVQVDRSTDTVLVRATIPNPNGLLVDGQFVNVKVERDTPEHALVIPQAAVQIDQTGRFVLVVDTANKVIVRRIQVGANIDADVVVTQGLKEGERIIVDGIQKVRPGIVVEPSDVKPHPQA